MTETIAQIIKEHLAAEGMSLRQAGREIGIAHTTLKRILEGEPYDVTTAQKIADWLDLPLSTLLDARGSIEDNDTLAAQIAAVLATEPRLAEIFGRAMQHVQNGRISNETFRDLAAYAAFKFQLSEENDGDN